MWAVSTVCVCTGVLVLLPHINALLGPYGKPFIMTRMRSGGGGYPTYASSAVVLCGRGKGGWEMGWGQGGAGSYSLERKHMASQKLLTGGIILPKDWVYWRIIILGRISAIIRRYQRPCWKNLTEKGVAATIFGPWKHVWHLDSKASYLSRMRATNLPT